MNSDRTMKLEWLSRGKAVRLKLIGLYAERQERLSRAEYAGIHYGERTGHSSGNSTESKIAAIAEVDAEIAVADAELKRIEDEIRLAIDQVRTPIYQTYLRMRFLGYKTEPQIAKETGYSIEHIKKHIKRRAVDAVKVDPI